MNILGVVVRTQPEKTLQVRRALEESGECEVYGEDVTQGKLVVVIEGEDDSDALGKLRRIGALENVTNADLIHLASQSDPNSVAGADANEVSKAADAETVLYGGSVYNWLAKS